MKKLIFIAVLSLTTFALFGQNDKGLEVGSIGNRYGWISLRKTTTGAYPKGYHGFEDNSLINLSGGFYAYCSFSAVTQITGSVNYDHIVGFQTYSSVVAGSNANVLRMDGFATLQQHHGSGTITKLAGFHALDPLGNEGTVTNNYGLLIEDLTRGINNYSIWTGTAPSYFGGKVTINQFLKLTPLSSAPSPAAEVNAICGANATTLLKGYKLVIKDTSGSGLTYRFESDGTSWIMQGVPVKLI